MAWVSTSAGSESALSHDWPWYWPSYGEKLTDEGKAVFASCGIQEDELEQHILSVVYL
jgi:hypothetical protein